jgi:acetyl-CoA carboxylase biotin carboxyl carrier protein
VDLKEVRELIKILEKSGLSELEIEEEGRRIRLSKGQPAAAAPAMSYMMNPALEAPAMMPVTMPDQTAQAAVPVSEEQAALDEGLITINSPMVGTYYACPAPGEPPFVLPGDTVEADQAVCIVEAMKIMNEVSTKEAGVIEKILVENAEPVEFGQPLFAVRPLA